MRMGVIVSRNILSKKDKSTSYVDGSPRTSCASSLLSELSSSTTASCLRRSLRAADIV